jgi:hypothetical protein
MDMKKRDEIESAILLPLKTSFIARVVSILNRCKDGINKRPNSYLGQYTMHLGANTACDKKIVFRMHLFQVAEYFCCDQAWFNIGC